MLKFMLLLKMEGWHIVKKLFTEFTEARQLGFLHAKKIKDNGGLIAGCFCAFAPRELLAAAGFTTVNICNTAKDHELAAIADQMPHGICSAVRATYGLALSDKCPYIHFSDILIGEDVCGRRLQIYQLLRKIKDVYILQLPKRSDTDFKMEKELRNFASELADRYNCQISDAKLQQEIVKSNQQTQTHNKLVMMCRENPPLLSGYNLAKILDGAAFIFDHQDKLQKLNAAIDQAAVSNTNNSGKRIIISGCGLNGLIDKVIKPVEELGANIVAFDNCRWGLSPLIDESIAQTNPWQALAKKHNLINCPIHQTGQNSLSQLIKDADADALINVRLGSCCICPDLSGNDIQVPTLDISTDYSDSDKEVLKQKIAMFLAK